jgi:phosphatidylserine decarboxylase
MRSTHLADLFYTWDINPFYVILALMFLVPLSSILFFFLFLRYDLFFSVIYTSIVFLFCCVIFYLHFTRDPYREIIEDDRAILSPADGTIVYIKEITQGTIIESEKKKNQMKLTELLDIDDTETGSSGASGFIIGVELRLFDVHITRAPITGTILLQHHVSGRIVTVNNPGFEYINDRETVVLRQETQYNKGSLTLQIAVVQIATFITRTLKSLVKDKKHIRQGEPLGMIRLGSQVDLVIYSKNIRILVKEHDRVYAGITKIAETTTA